jgi:hypothetical protein
MNNRKQYGRDDDQMERTSPPEDLSIGLKGRYDFVVSEELLQIMDSQKRIDVTWKFDDKNSKQSKRTHQLHGDFVQMLRRRLQTSVGTTVVGYTKAVISCLGIRTQFYAHPCFHGRKWYDWALVHFEEQDNQGGVVETHYPSRVLGYVSIDGKQEAFIQCSSKPILWSTVERKFIVPIKLGTDFNISFVSVPIDALVHPLCVFPNVIDGECDIFYVVLAKRNWSRFFGNRIQIK